MADETQGTAGQAGVMSCCSIFYSL